MLRKTLKWILGIVGLVLVAATIFLVNLIWFRPWSLDLFYEKVFVQVLFEEPELLSSVGLVEQFGIRSHSGKLGDESPAHQQHRFERAKQNLADLRAYSLDRQTPSQRLSTHILDWYLEREVEGEKYEFHNYPVNQLFGVQNEFPSFMANTHRLLDARDCEYYIERLHALPRKFDQLLEGLRLREQKQIVPPRFVVEKVLLEMRGFVSQPAQSNILATSFKARTAKIAGLTDEQRASLQARVEAAITGDVFPAYEKLIDYFNDLLPKTTTDDGVWKLPDGDAFYAYVLRKNTTTALTPTASARPGLAGSDENRGGNAADSRHSRICRAHDSRVHRGASEGPAIPVLQRRERPKRRARRIHAPDHRGEPSDRNNCSSPCPPRKSRSGAFRNSRKRRHPAPITTAPLSTVRGPASSMPTFAT